MNYTLQLHGERMEYPVPSGLYELMSDIAREVLRDQPVMLYQYIAHYMDTLVRVREYARTAAHVVDGVTQDNVELLSYVSSLGVPYEMADLAARKIQRAFRTYQAKHNLKLAVRDHLKQLRVSEDFQQILDTYDLDQETADKSSSVIQKAFKVYQSKKLLEERKDSRDASTHTIDSISFKPQVKVSSLLREKKPPKRDSTLMVYQQSPKASVLSTWSTLGRDLAGKVKPSVEEDSEPKLVYEQADTSSWTTKRKEVSDYSLDSDNMKPLPSYYESHQPKIPMISEAGLLRSDIVSEIVTLFSTDSVDENQGLQRGSAVPRPSFSNLSPPSNPEALAKELFDIIGKTSKSTSTFITQPVQSLSGTLSDDVAKPGKEPSVLVQEPLSVSAPTIASTDRASKKNLSMVDGN